MPSQFDRDHLTDKIATGKRLTREEEQWYLINVLRVPAHQVERLFAINDQTKTGSMVG